MMQNDSCRNIMGQRMMEKPEMMGMIMNIPKHMKGSMDQIYAMANKDTVMFNSMIEMMKERPEMWNKVMTLNTSNPNTN